MDQLAQLLEQEAEFVELAIFRVKSVELLLVASEHRFLSSAVDELEEIVEELAGLETVRAMRTETIAQERGVPRKPAGGDDPDDEGDRQPEPIALSHLLEAATYEERVALQRARTRLRDLLSELDALVATSRTLAMTRVAEVRSVLERLSGLPAMRYGRDGIPMGQRPHSVDRRL